MDSVEAGQGPLPAVVDGAMALVGDDHVVMAGGVVLDPANHGLEQRDRDLLFLSHHPRAEPVAGMLPQHILDRLQELLGKLVTIHEDEHTLGPVGVEQTLQIEADEIGLARSGGQLDQEAALAEFQRVVESTHGLGLVGAHGARFALADVVLRNRDRREGLVRAPQHDHAFEIALREEPLDRSRVVFLPVPEVGEFPVRQEDEGCVQGLRVREGLLLGDVRVDRVLLGLNDGQGTAALVVQDVVSTPGGLSAARR